MINPKTMVGFAALLAGLIVYPRVCLCVQPDLIEATAGSAIAIERNAQDEVEAWDEQRAAIQEEISSLKTNNAWLAFQIDKYNLYIKKQLATIDELQRQREEMNRLRMELEPFLNQSLQVLEQQVSNDIPFLPEERQRRLAFLHESLNDYHISLSEKLRRLTEALQVEVAYGCAIDVVETSLDLNGSPIRVKLLRLGRAALFYQTLDAKESGCWNPQTQAWEKIDPGFGTAVGRAIDMAQRKRAIELLDLPIGAHAQ